MHTSNPQFRNALDGVVNARGREASRQVAANNAFQLIGAFTRRPN